MNKNTVAKKQTTVVEPEMSLMIRDDVGKFDDELVQGGMDILVEGYVAQYPYLVTASDNEFAIIRLSDGEEVYRAEELQVIGFYGHSVYRLHRGTLNGIGGNRADWDDEQREVVAQSYDNPFGRLKRSRGNFDLSGYGQYLDNKELRKEVQKRLYLVVAIPGILPKGALAICTFGGTAIKPFNDYAAMIHRHKYPVPFVITSLTLKRMKSESGNNYYQVMFRPATKNGETKLSAKNVDQYKTHFLPILEKIQNTHAFAVKQAEENVIPGGQAPKRKSQAQHSKSAAIEVESSVIYDDFEDEDIPF